MSSSSAVTAQQPTGASLPSAGQICASCHEPLLLDLSPDSDSDIDDDVDVELPDAADASDEEGDVEVGRAKGVDVRSKEEEGLLKVLDDIEVLGCGCHFHWECFMDSYTLTTCPVCGKDISSLSPTTGQQQVLVTVRNEGGVQENFDILPLAQEEAYLRTYPEERRGRAFLGFCAEGDVDAIVHLIRDEPDEDDEVWDKGVDVLRFTGGREGIMTVDGSGLHVAIENGRVDVAWLLLFLGSGLALEEFPKEVLEGAKKLGLRVEDRKMETGGDIRGLKNSEGLDAEAFAKKFGGREWEEWVASGRLRSP